MFLRLESMISRRYFHLHVSRGEPTVLDWSLAMLSIWKQAEETEKDGTWRTRHIRRIWKPFWKSKILICWQDHHLVRGVSLLQGLNKNKVPEEVRKQRLEKGREKVRIAVRYYKERRAQGRYFLHEHSAHATSWKEPEVVELMEQDDIYVVEGKPTKRSWRRYYKASVWTKRRAWHRHVMLVNGRAKAAQIYPPALVAAILKGIKAQMKEDGEIKDLGHLNVGAVPHEEPDCSEECFEGWFPEQKDEDDRIDVDDITGVQLPTEEVLKARQEELQWIHKQKIYEKRTLDECWEVTGKAPITLKWLDRNKGDSLHPNYRSRLVVREVKKQHGALPAHMLFSNMPPVEAAKILRSLLASKRTSKVVLASLLASLLALYDISRAHFFSESQRAVYVTLPEGDQADNMCALLDVWHAGCQSCLAGTLFILES